MRVLINAEPFGFGPSLIAKMLRDEISEIYPGTYFGYVGTGLTLDIHKKEDYAELCDYSTVSDSFLIEHCNSYDFIFSAMDLDFLKKISCLRPKISLIDALGWFWDSSIDMPLVNNYIEQPFLSSNKNCQDFSIHQYKISPLIPLLATKNNYFEKNVSPESIVVSLGGLENTLMSIDVLGSYANKMCCAIQQAFPSAILKIGCSSKISAYLRGFDAKPRSQVELYDLYFKSSICFATPGIGNILDASYTKSDCILLPPANDSQRKQLDVLREKGYSFANISWEKMLPCIPNISDNCSKLQTLNHITNLINEINIPSLKQAIIQQAQSNDLAGLHSLYSRLYNEKNVLPISRVLKEIFQND